MVVLQLMDWDLCKVGFGFFFSERQRRTGNLLCCKGVTDTFSKTTLFYLAVGVKMLEHLREILRGGCGFWGAFADGWWWVLAHLPGGAGSLASCDPAAGSVVGGGREEQLFCPSPTLNPALLVNLITNVLLVVVFAWGLDCSSSPLDHTLR